LRDTRRNREELFMILTKNAERDLHERVQEVSGVMVNTADVQTLFVIPSEEAGKASQEESSHLPSFASQLGTLLEDTETKLSEPTAAPRNASGTHSSNDVDTSAVPVHEEIRVTDQPLKITQVALREVNDVIRPGQVEPIVQSNNAIRPIAKSSTGKKENLTVDKEKSRSRAVAKAIDLSSVMAPDVPPSLSAGLNGGLPVSVDVDALDNCSKLAHPKFAQKAEREDLPAGVNVVAMRPSTAKVLSHQNPNQRIGKAQHVMPLAVGTVARSSDAIPAKEAVSAADAESATNIAAPATPKAIAHAADVVVDPWMPTVTAKHPLNHATETVIASTDGTGPNRAVSNRADIEPGVARSLPDRGATLATSSSLEMEVPSSSHGVLKVKAELTESGAIKATLSSSSPNGAQMFHRELPALASFLADEKIHVSNVVIDTSAGSMDLSRDRDGQQAAADQSFQQFGDGQRQQSNDLDHQGRPSVPADLLFESLDDGASAEGHLRHGQSWLSVRA